MSLYAWPLAGRAGLGNALLPWARAELFARAWDVPVLAPWWGRPRIGPYLRREPDKRRYGRLFHARDHVDGIARAAIGAFGRRLAEDEPVDAYAEAKRASRPHAVRFEGLGTLFAPLIDHHIFVRHKLWQMTVEPLRATGAAYGSRFVAMHVRRGDLTRQGFSSRALNDEVLQFTPLPWFVAMARALRRTDAFRALPLVVFTDGSTEELAALLRLEGVRLHPRQPAISDLWTMSHASLLFASGYSTFGMWASYLGGMPTVYAPGKRQQRVQGARASAIEIELGEDDALPAALVPEAHASALAAS